MASNNFIITNFLIFCFFILGSFEQKVITQRKPELRKMEYLRNDDEDYSSDIDRSSDIEEPSKEINYYPSIARPTLLGFGNYRKEKKGNEIEIKFTVFIKKLVNAIKSYDYIHFTLVFIVAKNMRGLEETEPKRLNIPGKLNASFSNYFYDKYEVNITENQLENAGVPQPDSIKSITFEDNIIVSNKETYDGVYNITEKSNTYLNPENINIMKEESDLNNILFFQVLFLTKQSYVYDLYGNITSSDGEVYNIKKENIEILYKEKNYIDLLRGNIETSQNKSYQYKIRFFIERSINTNLDGALIDVTDLISTKLRNLESSKTNITLCETKDISLNVNEEYISEPKYYTRKVGSGSGLSGGAIAGIIIVSIVVLIAIAFTFIYLNKRPNLPISHSSALEFYNSSSSMQN